MPSTTDPESLKIAQELVMQHPDMPLREVARRAKISFSTLYEKVVQKGDRPRGGNPPVSKTALRAAESLLEQQPNLRVSEVARQVGVGRGNLYNHEVVKNEDRPRGLPRKNRGTDAPSC